MTDPLDVLRSADQPVDPDPDFAAQLRARLERALGRPEARLPRGVEPMTSTTTRTTGAAADAALSPTLIPYVAVRDAGRALDWYVDVFAARVRGEPIVMDDGRVGHAEIVIGDSVLMLAEEFPEIDFVGPESRGGTTVSLHLTVPDVDRTVERAVRAGASLDGPVEDQSYGRTGVLRDPFGHRWMVQTPPAPAGAEASAETDAAGTTRPGDLGYVTLRTPDDERAKAFYGPVLGWRFTPGHVERGWNIDGTRPMSGLWGGAREPGVMLMYAVADLDAAVRAVREHGGRADEPTTQPYGRSADCVDDQGFAFSLWQP